MMEMADSALDTMSRLPEATPRVAPVRSVSVTEIWSLLVVPKMPTWNAKVFEPLTRVRPLKLVAARDAVDLGAERIGLVLDVGALRAR